MKIVYVAGGSYKSFYLNYFLKLNRCDLLLFNTNIIYDYVAYDELLGNATVTKELMMLANKLHCVVVACCNVRSCGVTKSLIMCDGDKIHIAPINVGIRINVRNKLFIAGNKYTDYLHYNKIIFSDKQIIVNEKNCSKRKIYLFCDRYGLNLVENKKLTRKFSKYSKIILK